MKIFSPDFYMQQTYHPVLKLLNLTLQLILVGPGKPTVHKLIVSGHSRIICISKLWYFSIYWLLESFLAKGNKEGQIQLTDSPCLCPSCEEGEICDVPAVLLLVSHSEGDPVDHTVLLLHCLRSLWVINKRFCTRPHFDMECAHSITYTGEKEYQVSGRE